MSLILSQTHHFHPPLLFQVQAWRFAGDSYATKPGDKPWISEMYGYSFGAAKAGVWHVADDSSMIYPGYEPRGGLNMSTTAWRAWCRLCQILPIHGHAAREDQMMYVPSMHRFAAQHCPLEGFWCSCWCMSRLRWEPTQLICCRSCSGGCTPTGTLVQPPGMPRIIHYGLEYSVEHTAGTWSWDKHWWVTTAD